MKMMRHLFGSPGGCRCDTDEISATLLLEMANITGIILRDMIGDAHLPHLFTGGEKSSSRIISHTRGLDFWAA